MNGNNPRNNRSRANNNNMRPASPRNRADAGVGANHHENRRNMGDDALNEHYEDMVDERMSRRINSQRSDIASNVSRDTYADLSTFESHGHRVISPEVMRRKRQREMIRKMIPVCFVAVALIVCILIYAFAISPARKYSKAKDALEVTNYNAAKDIFDKLGGYKDSEKYVKYIDAIMALDSKDYDRARELFSSLSGFIDSSARLASIPSDNDMQNAENEEKYQSALRMYNSGDYVSAKNEFSALGGYKDSKEKLAMCDEAVNNEKYSEACKALEDGDNVKAARLFTELGDFKDSKSKLAEIGVSEEQGKLAADYAAAKEMFNRGDYSGAYEAFGALGGYSDSTDYVQYCYAMIFLNEKNYERAEEEFRVAGDFLDAPDKILECQYDNAKAAYSDGNYEKAIELFSVLGNYSDSASQLANAKAEYDARRYEDALFKYYAGDIDGALELFTQIENYSDSAEWVKKLQEEKQSKIQ